MKKTLLIVAAILIQLFCVAQKNGQYDLMLSSGVVNLQANFEQVKSQKPQQTEVFNGAYYRYIQFYTIPSTEQKKQLAEKGIDLLLYLPTNTYIASIKEKCTIITIFFFNSIFLSEVYFEKFLKSTIANAAVKFDAAL